MPAWLLWSGRRSQLARVQRPLCGWCVCSENIVCVIQLVVTGLAILVVIIAGYVCDAGSTSASPRLCDAGSYCVQGIPYPCPAGRYSTDSGGSSLSACTPCPAGTYSASIGSSVDTCVMCTPPEDSDSGAAACWPGVLGVVASSSTPVVLGVSSSALVLHLALLRCFWSGWCHVRCCCDR